MNDSVFDFDVRSSAVDSLHAQTAIYTSRSVVDGLLDRVGWPNDGGGLLDPSCGDGAFLIAALERLMVRPDDPASVARVRGWEIHPGAVQDCRGNIAAWLIERGWAVGPARKAAMSMVVEADFLTDFPEAETYDLILGNPPYLRYAFVPPYFQDIYRDRLPSFVHGDLLHAFLFKCTQLLRPDGVIGMVTADRWCFNESCSELRARLGDLVGISHLARLDCETSFYRPKRRVTGSLPRVHPVEVVLRPKAFALRAITAEPMRIDDGALAGASGRVLSDIADVRLGPWLSKPGTFVVPNTLAIELVEAGFTGARLVPAVVGKERDIDWTAGCLREPTFQAIVTSRDTVPTGSVATHIKATAGMHSDRANDRAGWWLPPELIVPEILDYEKIMVPIISKVLRSVRVPAGILAHSHQVVIIIPKAGSTFADIEAALAEPEAQAYWQSMSKPIENGYFQCGASIIRNLPIA